MSGGVGALGLCLKSTSWGELLIRNWLALGGGAPQGSARPQLSKHPNTENERPG